MQQLHGIFFAIRSDGRCEWSFLHLGNMLLHCLDNKTTNACLLLIVQIIALGAVDVQVHCFLWPWVMESSTAPFGDSFDWCS